MAELPLFDLAARDTVRSVHGLRVPFEQAPDRVVLRFLNASDAHRLVSISMIDPATGDLRGSFDHPVLAGATSVLDMMTPRLRQGLLFLEASMSPEPLPTLEPDDQVAYSLRLPIETLARLLDRGASATEAQVDFRPMRVGALEKGPGLIDPALLELTSRFQSVDTVDPLSDRAVRR